MIEFQVLIHSRHPFLCSMAYAYQTEERFYFIMPFVGGGELNRILQIQERFSETETRFYIT